MRSFGGQGGNVLLRNEGGGRFVDAAAEAGVQGPEGDMSTAACWADFDGDGWLDLYVSNYVDMRRVIEDFRKEGRAGRSCDWRGFRVYCGPMQLPYQDDRLYLSNGRDPATGRVAFRDATANLKGQQARPSFQCIGADFDGDGDMDVFTANDTEPHHLWLNDGKGNFTDEGKVAGCAYVATVVPNNPRRVESVIKKAVLIAREVGSSYIQAYTSCNIEYAIPTDKVMEDAKAVENDRYQFTEYVSDEAKRYLTERYGYKEFLQKPAAPAAAIPHNA